WRDIPVILATAIDADSAYVERAYRLGVADFIFKPIDPTLLRSKVAIFAELFRKRHQFEQQAQLVQRAREEEHARMARLLAIQQATSKALTGPHGAEEALPKILRHICT